MPTSNTEELGRFLKCTVIGRGVFGPCACCIFVVPFESPKTHHKHNFLNSIFLLMENKC